MSGWLAVSVAIGGAIGSLGRFAAGRLMLFVAGPAFPWGTLVVNLVGSFAIGLWVACLARINGPVDSASTNAVFWDHAVRIGILGGFTTFSSFSHETLQLLMENKFLPAAVHILGNLMMGLLLVWFGMKLGFFLTNR